MKELNQIKFSLRQGLIENENTPTHQGQPIPTWLQPIDEETAQEEEEIPEWVLAPVNFD